jgi:hypothetical protein
MPSCDRSFGILSASQDGIRAQVMHVCDRRCHPAREKVVFCSTCAHMHFCDFRT